VPSEASHPPEEPALPLAPPSAPAAAAAAASPSSSSSSAAAAASSAPPKRAALSAEEQDELYREGGRELQRAWEREGGVRPGLARFERVLRGHDMENMERAWGELRKEGIEFDHFQKFITILLGACPGLMVAQMPLGFFLFCFFCCCVGWMQHLRVGAVDA
jgi:hypothetical protein